MFALTQGFMVDLVEGISRILPG